MQMRGHLMSRRRFLAGGSATLASVALLAACGGTTTTAPTATTGNATAAPTAGAGPAATAASTAAPAAPTAAAASPSAGGTAASSAAAATPATGKAPSGKVTIAQTATPLTLDGGLSSNIVDRNIYLALYDTLLNWKWQGDKGTIVPSLATDYRTVDDTTWQVKLRRGVLFHNGDPFTAADVKFTIERALDPAAKSSQKAFYSAIKRVDIVDDYTVNIVTDGPAATLPVRLTLFPMVPKKYVTESGDAKFAAQPVGTGPYTFVDFLKDDHLTLKANPKYWGTAPSIDTVVYNFIPSDASRVAAVRSGSVDVAVNFPPDSVKSLDGSSAREAHLPVDRGMLIYLDTIHGGPLADKRVRQALNYAVDKGTITKTVLAGGGTPISATIPSQFFGYDPSIEPYAYDPGKAKDLLKQAGFAGGFSMTLRHPNGFYPKDKEVAEAITGALGEFGIKIDDRGSESATYFTDLLGQNKATGGQPIGFLGSWGAPVFDVGIPWNEQFGTGSVIKLWQTDQFTSLVNQGLTTLDEGKRLTAYRQAHRLLYDEAPAVFLWQVFDYFGVNKRVTWTPRPDQLVTPTDMTLA